jgi:hypothetical protein
MCNSGSGKSTDQDLAGLNALRNHDRLSIYHRAKDNYFIKHEMPKKGIEQAQRMVSKFGHLLPSNSGTVSTLETLTNLFQNMMELKMDLLTSKDVYRVSYIPPNVIFDHEYMEAVYPEGIERQICEKNAAGFRKTICLHPLLTTMKDNEIPESANPLEYRNALLENRKFFPKVPGQYKDWKHDAEAHVVAKATVLVEEIPRTDTNIGETNEGRNGIDDDDEL